MSGILEFVGEFVLEFLDELLFDRKFRDKVIRKKKTEDEVI